MQQITEEMKVHEQWYQEAKTVKTPEQLASNERRRSSMAGKKGVGVTARKYMGDDAYSWAVFRSDQQEPVVTGLSKSEVPYYKARVLEIIKKEEQR